MSKSQDMQDHQTLVKAFVEAGVRIALIFIAVFLCLQIFSPFAGLTLWALILAIVLYPLHLKLTTKLNGKQSRSATIIVVTGLLLVGTPTVLIGDSFATHLHNIYSEFEQGELTIEPPNKSVADWPVIGNKVYGAWLSASQNLAEFIDAARPQLKSLSAKVTKSVANTASSILTFLASLIIAGIIMAYGDSGTKVTLRVFGQFGSTEKSQQLLTLIVNTVRSVMTGVLGVAFIQALLLGVGFVLAGVPAAGILAIAVMIVGILQIPAAIIWIPAVAYMWTNGDASTTMNIVWTIYLSVAGLADNVLKPLLLGRGVDVPMPIILFGALGGMMSAGIIGLFIGAALLAIGYQLFTDWLNNSGHNKTDAPADSANGE